MTTREYIARVNEINAYLSSFPPFQANQKIPEDEILDILEFGVPSTWQKEFWRQGYDPIARSINDFTDFCERLEFTEDLYDSARGSKKRSRTDDDQKASKKANSERKSNAATIRVFKKTRNNKWCEYHQTSSHNTNKCKVVLAQACKMRAAWENKTESSKREERSKSKQQLNLLVEKKLSRF